MLRFFKYEIFEEYFKVKGSRVDRESIVFFFGLGDLKDKYVFVSSGK